MTFLRLLHTAMACGCTNGQLGCVQATRVRCKARHDAKKTQQAQRQERRHGQDDVGERYARCIRCDSDKIQVADAVITAQLHPFQIREELRVDRQVSKGRWCVRCRDGCCCVRTSCSTNTRANATRLPLCACLYSFACMRVNRARRSSSSTRRRRSTFTSCTAVSATRKRTTQTRPSTSCCRPRCALHPSTDRTLRGSLAPLLLPLLLEQGLLHRSAFESRVA